MALVIESSASCDGWNVRVNISGSIHTLHFPSEPSEQQIAEAIVIREQQLLAEVVESHINENEEVLI